MLKLEQIKNFESISGLKLGNPSDKSSLKSNDTNKMLCDFLKQLQSKNSTKI